MKLWWRVPTASPRFLQQDKKYISGFQFTPESVYDIWLQDGGTEKCSDDIGKQKGRNLVQWKARGSGESRENQNQSQSVKGRKFLWEGLRLQQSLWTFVALWDYPILTLREGDSRPQQAFQRNLSIKTSLQTYASKFASSSLNEEYSILQHSQEILLPNSSLLFEKQSQCFPHYFVFAAYLSPTVTAIWPAVRSETLREREREVCVRVHERSEMMRVSAMFWLVYIH